MLLTIILCVYNEKNRIERAYQQLQSQLTGSKHQSEVIIIDNGSSDGTRDWLKTVSEPNTTVIFNESNLGKGGSIKLGIRLSKGEYILIHDPDLEYDAKDILPLINLALTRKADLALGSRVLGGTNISYKYLQNYIGVAVLTKIINMLYRSNITDPATAMKLMKASFIKNICLKNSGFNLDFEIVVKTLRLSGTVVENRISYYPRTKAEGKKLNAWKDGFASLITILINRFQTKEKMRSI
jgi:dolichol-phosphate mannosyltransferase